MRRIGVGVQEMDDQRVRSPRPSGRRPRCARSASSSGVRTAPAGLHPLANLEPEVARDDRHEGAGHAVGLRPGAAAELDDVAEPARGDHAGLGQPPLQHRIGGRRRAVDDEIDRRRSENRSRPAPPSRRRPGSPASSASWRSSHSPPSRPSNRIRSVKVPPTSIPATTAPADARTFSTMHRNPKRQT